MKGKKNVSAKKKKMNLAKMSTEEFMEHGFDSDIEDGDIEEEKEEENKTKGEQEMPKMSSEDESLEEEIDPESDENDENNEIEEPEQKDESAENSKSENIEGKSHKSQLERLKEKDPEFYKYLQDHDEELLEFSGSDEDLSDESDLDDKVSENKEDEGDDDDNEDDIDAEEEVEEGKRVTHDMIKKWKSGLENEELKTLKTVMAAFHASVSAMGPDEDDKETAVKQSRFSAKEGTIFNSLATLCLKHTCGILDKNIPYAKDKKTKTPLLPSSSRNWGKIKVTIKQYLLDLMQLLRQLSDPSMLAIILRHCQLMCPYYCCFPKILKMFLKRLARMWSSGEEHVRVLAFMCIRKCTSLHPNLFEFILKKMYFGYVQHSKFVSQKTRPTLAFMKNSLVEMFSVNETITYQHAFVYIRQLAIHLRNAITVKKKDGHLAVYNWQFVMCLKLWSEVVGELYGDVLKPLVYPIVQITLGVVRLVPAARYFPIRFQCIEILNYISEKTNVYIPTASYVLEAIESLEFLKKPKTTDKVPSFKYVLKVSKSQTTSKTFQDTVVDVAFESLLKHYVVYSNSIAFPELTFPICHRLKKLTKNCKVFKLAKDMRTLVDKLQKHGESVTKIRGSVTFSPKDLEKVHEWEEEQKLTSNTLHQFYETWKRMKDVNKTNVDEADNGENDGGDNNSKVPNNRKRKGGQVDDKQSERLKAKKKEPKKTKAKKTRELSKSNPIKQDEDIIEDFKFSDDEE